MTNDVEPPAILVSIWVMATGVLDDEDLDNPNEISSLRADRLSGIAKLIRDYVHPSHWPAFETRARALEQELQEWADRPLES
jgi:hypothetical protein